MSDEINPNDTFESDVEVLPSEEGKRRNPETGGYYDGYACTCEPSCKNRCAGECGCPGHTYAFAEFCDYAGLYKSGGGLIVTEEEALRRYRSDPAG